MEIAEAEVVLCEFHFSHFNALKKRPVLVLKDNLPYDDFVGIPISSQIGKLHNLEKRRGNNPAPCFTHSSLNQ